MAPIFDDARPGLATTERTPGRYRAIRSPAEQGWLHCGPTGAGHFVKMVHNGIEYGLMAAYAEGLNVLAKADIGAEDHAQGRRDRAADPPRVLPVRLRPGGDHRGVATRQRGLQLAARPHRRGPGRRSGARRGSRATSATAARAAGRSTPRSTRACRRRCCRAALYDRFSSRGRADVADKMLSAMRAQFGGHVEANAGTPRMSTSSDATAASRRRPGAVRRHRRPRQAQAVPGAVPPGAPRQLKIPVIGVARSDWTDEAFRENAHDAIIAADARRRGRGRSSR